MGFFFLVSWAGGGSFLFLRQSATAADRAGPGTRRPGRPWLVWAVVGPGHLKGPRRLLRLAVVVPGRRGGPKVVKALLGRRGGPERLVLAARGVPGKADAIGSVQSSQRQVHHC